MPTSKKRGTAKPPEPSLQVLERRVSKLRTQQEELTDEVFDLKEETLRAIEKIDIILNALDEIKLLVAGLENQVTALVRNLPDLPEHIASKGTVVPIPSGIGIIQGTGARPVDANARAAIGQERKKPR